MYTGTSLSAHVRKANHIRDRPTPTHINATSSHILSTNSLGVCIYDVEKKRLGGGLTLGYVRTEGRNHGLTRLLRFTRLE